MDFNYLEGFCKFIHWDLEEGRVWKGSKLWKRRKIWKQGKLKRTLRA